MWVWVRSITLIWMGRSGDWGEPWMCLSEGGERVELARSAARAPMDPLWQDEPADRGLHEEELVVDIAGFEGPLDLLLHLARNQRVDLSRISILALVEQYLTFVETARALRLELAADYLVMAAWL